MQWMALLAVLIVSVSDDSWKVRDMFASMAGGLSEGNAGQFLRAFDRSMPGYEALAANVRALLQQADVLNSVEVLDQTVEGAHPTAQLDWFLEITPKQDTAALERRRQIVKCRLEKQRDRWRIVALEPASFFAPPKVRQP
jgi:hypothetical protein